MAGVAQRTGATVYYIEMAPHRAGDPMPVFSLMPAAGDVDIMIAAEMMEAGRSIIRGFVTPDRTTLIASTHRALAVSEKMVPGDGIASSAEVMAAAEIAAQRFIAADFDALAIANGSVISAALFGALAGSGALPFDRAAFEAAIRASGKGVDGSLRAFGAALAVAANPVPEEARPKPTAVAAQVTGPARLMADWGKLAARVAALPAPVADMAMPGLRKVVDFQDIAYGAEYLDRLASVMAQDNAAQGWALSREAAKYIANAMAYDDIIRVADLKTRGRRFDRIRREMRVKEANLLHLTEFFHPRAEEIVGLFPARLGARVEADPKWMARLDRWFNKGRRLRTDSLRAFVTLHVVGGLRGWRRRTLRHAQEQAHLARWLATALAETNRNYDLGGRTHPLPPSDQGLFRYPCARPVEIRPRPCCHRPRSQRAPMPPTGAAACVRPRCWMKRARRWMGPSPQSAVSPDIAFSHWPKYPKAPPPLHKRRGFWEMRPHASSTRYPPFQYINAPASAVVRMARTRPIRMEWVARSIISSSVQSKATGAPFNRRAPVTAVSQSAPS